MVSLRDQILQYRQQAEEGERQNYRSYLPVGRIATDRERREAVHAAARESNSQDLARRATNIEYLLQRVPRERPVFDISEALTPTNSSVVRGIPEGESTPRMQANSRPAARGRLESVKLPPSKPLKFRQINLPRQEPGNIVTPEPNLQPTMHEPNQERDDFWRQNVPHTWYTHYPSRSEFNQWASHMNNEMRGRFNANNAMPPQDLITGEGILARIERHVEQQKTEPPKVDVNAFQHRAKKPPTNRFTFDFGHEETKQNDLPLLPEVGAETDNNPIQASAPMTINPDHLEPQIIPTNPIDELAAQFSKLKISDPNESDPVTRLQTQFSNLTISHPNDMDVQSNPKQGIRLRTQAVRQQLQQRRRRSMFPRNQMDVEAREWRADDYVAGNPEYMDIEPQLEIKQPEDKTMRYPIQASAPYQATTTAIVPARGRMRGGRVQTMGTTKKKKTVAKRKKKK